MQAVELEVAWWGPIGSAIKTQVTTLNTATYP